MKTFKITLGIVLCLIFVWIGYVYATHTAQTLPHFFPGFEANLSTKHIKHSIAAFVVAILLFIYAWFQTGNNSGTPTSVN